MVIKADALHYKTDVYSNIAVFKFTYSCTFYRNRISWCDCRWRNFYFWFIYSAYELIQEGVLVLLDRAVDEKTIKDIVKIIEVEDKVNTHHLLKTREAGSQTFVWSTFSFWLYYFINGCT